MDKKYEKLFEPAKIGNMYLKNRFVLGAIGTSGVSEEGYDSRNQDFWEERAKGGVGMIIIMDEFVTNKIDPCVTNDDYGTVKQLNRLIDTADRLKPYGAKLCLQLSYGLGKNGFVGIGESGYDSVERPLSASEVPTLYNPDVKPVQ